MKIFGILFNWIHLPSNLSNKISFVNDQIRCMRISRLYNLSFYYGLDSKLFHSIFIIIQVISLYNRLIGGPFCQTEFCVDYCMFLQDIIHVRKTQKCLMYNFYIFILKFLLPLPSCYWLWNFRKYKKYIRNNRKSHLDSKE